MVTEEKQALSDFSEIFQENYDKIPNEQERLAVFFKNVNKWLYKPIPKTSFDKDFPHKLYQYSQEAQSEFLEFQSELSGITKAVYTVVADVNKITQSGTEAYQKSDYVRKEGDPNQGERQVINVNTGKPSIFGKMMGKKPDTNLPKSLEDAWVKSENWKDEVMNIPNIWRKLVVYHHYGVKWQTEFDGYGMDDYLSQEVTFLNTRVEPLISNIVMRALEIRTGEQTEKIERIYTGTLAMEKELETAKIMTGQSGGGDNSPPSGS